MTNKLSGVYIITNTANGKRYIGSSVDIHRRWITHVRDLRKGLHGNQVLQRAWVKYGESSFEFTILLVCTKDDTLLHEQRYLDEEKPEYNICLSTTASMLGVSMSDATKQKIGNANRGHVMSEEQKLKLSEVHKGRPWSDEHRAKMIGRQAHTGYKFTDEQKEHLRQSHLGIKQSDEQKEHSRQAHIGLIRSDEHSKHLSEALTGRVIPEETKEKIRATLLARPFTYEFTNEHKEHLREAWVRRRNGSLT